MQTLRFSKTFQSLLASIRLVYSNLPPGCLTMCWLLSACLPTCLFISFLSSCANPVQPSGGAKDELPPRLDSLRSTRNYQTQFRKQTIVLSFDEWVELRDVFNQVVISPPLEYRLNIVRRKKTIQASFDEREVLRENATYVLNFGQAIRDLTEGNVAPVTFVFSTGDYIDSLSVEGKIVDAFSGQPVEKVLFMLYENLADSVVRKKRPFYFARTDKQGVFKVNNVKPGIFKGVALLDQNLNYRFDGDTEQIGFLDSALVLNDSLLAVPADSTEQEGEVLPDSLGLKTVGAKVFIRLFSEEKPLFLRGKETATYGLVKLVFNRSPYDAVIRFDSIGQHLWQELESDTIRLWYDTPMDTAWNVLVGRDTLTDTIQVKGGLKETFLNTATLKVASTGPSERPVKQHLQKPCELKFNHPLRALSEKSMQLTEDTTRQLVFASFQIDTANRRNLLINYPWKENTAYQVVLLPGSLTDFFGLQNADTIRLGFTTFQRKDLGTLNLKVRNLNPERAYVVRVLGQQNLVIGRFEVSGEKEFNFVSGLLMPDTYSVEVVEDDDGNGRWTTGHYDSHRQPERVFVKKLEPLRANWELEAKVVVVFE